MNEDDEARLSKAAMKSLRVPVPESLKADLKRLSHSRKLAPAIWEGLREALSGRAWTYGAGAAFAAAAIGIFVLRAIPQRDSPPALAENPRWVEGPRFAEGESAQALQDLWSDDDGEDNDEI